MQPFIVNCSKLIHRNVCPWWPEYGFPKVLGPRWMKTPIDKILTNYVTRFLLYFMVKIERTCFTYINLESLFQHQVHLTFPKLHFYLQLAMNKYDKLHCWAPKWKTWSWWRKSNVWWYQDLSSIKSLLLLLLRWSCFCRRYHNHHFFHIGLLKHIFRINSIICI